MILKILTIKFGAEIKQNEVPLLRGAIINMVPHNSILMHNHIDDSKFRYSYPLVQYKIINHKAAIISLGDGIDAIGEFFSTMNHEILLGEREVSLEVEDISAKKVIITEIDPMRIYKISFWLPLNQDNFKIYEKKDSIGEKYNFLENILKGNILSFCKGIGYHIDFNLQVLITKIKEGNLTRYKNIKMQSFNAEFKTNINLPNLVGLGKGVSLGFGTISRKKAPEEFCSEKQQ
jgi:hypothetical protein